MNIDIVDLAWFILIVLLFVRNRQTRYLDYLRAKLHIEHAFWWGKVRGIKVGRMYAEQIAYDKIEQREQYWVMEQAHAYDAVRVDFPSIRYVVALDENGDVIPGWNGKPYYFDILAPDEAHELACELASKIF
jgi:hypothetical protein